MRYSAFCSPYKTCTACPCGGLYANAVAMQVSGAIQGSKVSCCAYPDANNGTNKEWPQPVHFTARPARLVMVIQVLPQWWQVHFRGKFITRGSLNEYSCNHSACQIFYFYNYCIYFSTLAEITRMGYFARKRGEGSLQKLAQTVRFVISFPKHFSIACIAGALRGTLQNCLRVY